MLETVSTADQFRQRWGGIHNFVMSGACVPFAMALPPLDEIIDVVRRDEHANVLTGPTDPFNHIEPVVIKDQFAKLPIERAMEQSFRMFHYDLCRFDTPGGLLEGLDHLVLRPWRAFLEGNGFALTDFFRPYFFISGPNCVTEYHMDFSHVLAWQQYGVKSFCSFKDPYRWADETVRREQMVEKQSGYNQPIPAGIRDDDVVECEMQPGVVLWNVLQTPHWVKAGSDVALSLNISHRGLRLDGELCLHEQQLEDWLAELDRPSMAGTS